jgi:putative flippase GtrA
MEKLTISPKFAVYVAGGVLCACIDIGLMQLLVLAKVSAVKAASAGFVAGLLVNYAFHAKVTFNSVTSTATFTRFMCLVAINYLITITLVGVAQHLFSAPLLGKLVSLPAVAVNGFFVSKRWIYK